ncbi:MAG: rubrerythrin family protein [Candidatus Pacearchaeota archaeon]
MELKGSETEKNLLKSFAGESQVRNKYNYFASVAKKEGYEQISAIFTETADNEKEHAKIFFKYLKEGNGEALEITAKYSSGMISTTLDNLKAAADGENEEWSELYPEFERIARKEGFEEIADSFREIAEVEEEHEKRYRKLYQNLKDNTIFKKDKIVRWKCRNCGYVHEGIEAPGECPACKHPQAHYELLCENY